MLVLSTKAWELQRAFHNRPDALVQNRWQRVLEQDAACAERKSIHNLHVRQRAGKDNGRNARLSQLSERVKTADARYGQGDTVVSEGDRGRSRLALACGER